MGVMAGLMQRDSKVCRGPGIDGFYHFEDWPHQEVHRLGLLAELGLLEVFGVEVLGFRPLLFFVLPAAGFFCVGIMMAAFNYLDVVYSRKKKVRS